MLDVVMHIYRPYRKKVIFSLVFGEHALLKKHNHMAQFVIMFRLFIIYIYQYQKKEEETFLFENKNYP